MVTSTASASHDRPSIMMGGCAFEFVTTLAPERDDSGAILEDRPQERYAKRGTVLLNAHGGGPFCRFGINVEPGLTGVYALVVDEEIRYIGICQDLAKRFNGGYGIISPRKCYKGGQSTNCKVNRRILDTAKGGGSVDLYFYPTPQRKAFEMCLIALYLPPWNHRRATGGDGNEPRRRRAPQPTRNRRPSQPNQASHRHVASANGPRQACPARVRTSASIPAAVTAAPAPGPEMTRG